MLTEIKQLRKSKNINQQEIADKLGITRQTFAKMEQWKLDPTLWQAVKLAEIFGVSIEKFLSSDTQATVSKWIDWDKYKQIIMNFIHYGADSDGKITKTKLAKLCYLLDFSWYYFNLQSITWLEYKKFAQWPVPDEYFSTIEELLDEESIAIEIKWKSHLIQNIWNPSNDKILEDEMNMLQNIAKKWRWKQTQETVDFTHHQLPWMICKDKEIIPYNLITQEDEENVY